MWISIVEKGSKDAVSSGQFLENQQMMIDQVKNIENKVTLFYREEGALGGTDNVADDKIEKASQESINCVVEGDRSKISSDFWFGSVGVFCYNDAFK
ncbi:hypothetical protein [Bartonella rattimassiliensis]|uniref:Uncharacterized protein n=1 Tax=Bartonella rattimassiliensis 15908 TaxID=1094556 RepID=J1JFK6_9HYPH|nr:hypothetical protein [Bartonella rattimassiliensis]EJF83317.1 hypothetical protein MCY_01308 [Bartonella rattimassiliensis 15908]